MLIGSQRLPSNPLSVARPQASTPAPSTPPADRVSSGSLVPQEGLADRLLQAFKNLGKDEYLVDLERINRAGKAASNLRTPADFQARTAEFRARLARGESLESLRVEAYAVARQAAVVATGLRPYDCQVLGALAMDHGRIAEMMTGEGKTLTAVMPLYLNALAGKGAHLVTVNDTLAQRDRDTVAPIFETLGLSVGCVLEDMTPEQKRAGYAADITYTTDRSIGFDYLRDRTARSVEARVQRPLFFALVDEVDEVLLDEARTPLIISGQGQPASTDYVKVKDIVDDLAPGVDYFVDREKNAAWLSETGLSYVENELYGKPTDLKDAVAISNYHKRAASLRAEGQAWKAWQDHQKSKPGFFQSLHDHSWQETEQKLREAHQKAQERSRALGASGNLYAEGNGDTIAIVQASLKAHALFEEGVDYLVQDQKVKIVDENKGRTSEGRRYNEGLHQALEAKSGVPIRPESRAIASITYPNLFAKYERLAGMTGTAKTSEGEFESLYGLSVVQVPTNLQFRLNPTDPTEAPRHNRTDEVDAIYATKAEKFRAVVEEAVKSYQSGQPVLIGTLSVEANTYLHARLLEAGVAPAAVQVLNAEHVRGDKALENAIIAEAGRSGVITVATNMAGRGVDIKPDMVNYKALALRIEELAQAGQPVVVDLANEKEARRLAEWLDGNYPYRIDNAGKPEAGETLIRVASEDEAPVGAQSLKGSDFPTGGLYVIGTERAKSRRIDDQLIGRSGRQGQVGKSRFMLSLEDDLFRTFGGSKLQPTLALFSGDQGHLESDLLDGLVEKAQARVGEMHFLARETTTKYDEVLNVQRETFYSMRDEILEADASLLRQKLILDAQDEVVALLGAALPRDGKHSAAEVSQALAQIAERLFLPLQWNETRAPRKGELKAAVEAQVQAALEKALASFDASKLEVDELYKQSLLSVCDQLWGEHIEAMTSLKDTVQWVSAVEQDPEVVYKLKAFEAFEGLLDQIRKSSVEFNVPQVMVGAPILNTERSLNQAA
jgi:preprotein translocase subunit SecA